MKKNFVCNIMIVIFFIGFMCHNVKGDVTYITVREGTILTNWCFVDLKNTYSSTSFEYSAKTQSGNVTKISGSYTRNYTITETSTGKITRYTNVTVPYEGKKDILFCWPNPINPKQIMRNYGTSRFYAVASNGQYNVGKTVTATIGD